MDSVTLNKRNQRRIKTFVDLNGLTASAVVNEAIALWWELEGEDAVAMARGGKLKPIKRLSVPPTPAFDNVVELRRAVNV